MKISSCPSLGHSRVRLVNDTTGWCSKFIFRQSDYHALQESSLFVSLFRAARPSESNDRTVYLQRYEFRTFYKPIKQMLFSH